MPNSQIFLGAGKLIASAVFLWIVFGHWEAGRRKQLIDCGIRLLRLSLQVARQHKKLWIFPILQAIGFVFFTFGMWVCFIPGLMTVQPPFHVHIAPHFFDWLMQGQPKYGTNHPWFVLVDVIVTIGATFLSVAFFHEIIAVLAGDQVSLRRGCTLAAQRMYPIFCWSIVLVAAGRLTTYLSSNVTWAEWPLDTFWSFATLFVVPLIVRNARITPVGLLRRSGALIQNTWSESAIGYTGFYLYPWIMITLSIVMALGFVVIGFFLLGIFLFGVVPILALTHLDVYFAHLFSLNAFSASGNMGWILVGTGIGLIGAIIGGFYVVTDGVWRCALYTYATEGAVPEAYPLDMLDAVWKIQNI